MEMDSINNNNNEDSSSSLESQQIFYIILYATISVAAIGGNGIVIYLIVNFRKMRTVTNVFILNLAIGDLLMASLCIPFTVTATLLLHSWPFGPLMCRIVTFAQAASVFISAYTLVAISIDRYVAIIYPLRPRMTRCHCIQLIVIIWLVALLTPLPIALLSRLIPSPVLRENIYENNLEKEIIVTTTLATTVANDFDDTINVLTDSEQLNFGKVLSRFIRMNSSIREPDSNESFSFQQMPNITDRPSIEQTTSSNEIESFTCIEDWGWAVEYKSYYTVLLMVLQYGLPFSVLVFTYSRIAYVVWGKQVPGEADDCRDAKMAASKRKMIKMMITCVVTFTLCWLPLNILNVIGDRYSTIYDYEYIEYVYVACHWLAMSHSSMQPIIYVWMNARFRIGFRCVLGNCIPCLMPPDADLFGNGRSVATNIFTSSVQRKRSQYTYNGYSRKVTLDGNSKFKSCRTTPKASVLITTSTSTTANHRRKTNESNITLTCPNESHQKRFSYSCGDSETLENNQKQEKKHSPLSSSSSSIMANKNGNTFYPNVSIKVNECKMIKSRSYSMIEHGGNMVNIENRVDIEHNNGRNNINNVDLL
ncbi:hypothetical protein RDWZM_001374 [Blomia tropicalis]|uniref:G-protein coupled receptors family 1 profile domain-containing protein n=1 Tax=Blomia tropicalis TaxID=40697 RepID=A0A9Q0MCB6_BLOTA|nr:hypothetical protein RDWZM_001374 [Blomia tropicalis]